ncbi:MAG: hypothetical protein K5821_11965 [Nitrobacter sp.]|uniref:hypothetical protein n=1 Tax=Nitrobacter sp. TaxID=29420 RepID=UPI00262F8D44|nr:hypothetical protein [Nitrobacter sp.]MCV0387128.1 hypothetical protein [Nitrobacter sp.]
MDLVNLYIEDCGGRDNISETTRNHIRRIAYLQCVLEDCEAQYVRTGDTSFESRLEYQRLANSQSRLMSKIGLLIEADPKAHDDDDELDPLSYANGGSRPKRSKRSG